MNENELRELIRQIVTEMAAQSQPAGRAATPSTSIQEPAVEVVIRVSANGRTDVIPPMPECICPNIYADTLRLDKKTEALVQSIVRKTGQSRAQIVDQLMMDVRTAELTDRIEAMAKDIGVEADEGGDDE